jgi:hypothetical protein
VPFWDATQCRAVIFKDVSGQLIFPETSVRNYHVMLRNIPEERGYHLHRGAGLKSHIFKAFFLPELLDHEHQCIITLRKVSSLNDLTSQ